jgi:TolA-binding protein
LEKAGQSDEAIATLKRNLTNAPAARQREALTRITALALANNRLDVAAQSLEQYLAETNTPAADLAWLTLGEVNLKQHIAHMSLSATNGVATNYLALATNCFQQVLTSYARSDYAGKAQLNMGWCYWLEKRFAASAVAFEAATKRLPVSEDLVVAKFKLADAMFAMTNYSGALLNYRESLQLATNWPSVSAALSAPASYQALRASLELTNATGAEVAMRGILAEEAAGSSADGAVLLVAQAYVDANQSDAAQRLFANFVTRFPNSPLRPEAELLVARMREEQADWTNAAMAYELWVKRFPTNALRAQVEFQRALSAARAGNETNALKMFTNFVAEFPTNNLAARAQWWVADYFYKRENYAEAELNYKLVFQNWPAFELAYEARMMAGRAAVGKYAYDDAVEHFSSLTGDTNCPAELKTQAYFAYGGALMSSVPTATNKTDKLKDARQVFSVIVQKNSTNELGALAQGEIGNCYLQLASVAADASYFSDASNAYHLSFSMPQAGVLARSQSKVGLASVLEKQAALASNVERVAMLREARELDADVYFGKLGEHLNAGETPDAFWRKKAGSEAARLSELLGEWDQAIRFYSDMQREGQVLMQALQAIQR